MDLGTCGCVDHRQNFGPQSVESINTSAAHILARVNLKLGRVPTTSQSHSLGIDDATWLAEIRASKLWSMGHRLLLQRMPAAWNCSFIQYGKQVAGAAPAIVASYQQNCARAYTKSGCLLCVLIYVRNQDTGQRNSVPPTAPLNNQQNDPVVYLHFGELAQCLYLHCLLSTITEPRLCAGTQALPQCLLG